jgi:carbamoyltransferase
VAEEDVSKYFDFKVASPYMLMVANVSKGLQAKLPDNYDLLPLMERLYVQRSSLPAITHVDMSARVQTVSAMTNPLYYKLIKEFESKTSCGVLINTSFNVRGEPPVLTPQDAYRCFMETEMDVLVIGRYIMTKTGIAGLRSLKPQKDFILD